MKIQYYYNKMKNHKFLNLITINYSLFYLTSSSYNKKNHKIYENKYFIKKN